MLPGSSIIPEHKGNSDETVNLQKRTRCSITKAWRHYLNHDWLPYEYALQDFDPMEHNIAWVRQIRGQTPDSRTRMTNILEILQLPGSGQEPIKVLVDGEKTLNFLSNKCSTWSFVIKEYS